MCPVVRICQRSLNVVVASDTNTTCCVICELVIKMLRQSRTKMLRQSRFLEVIMTN